MRAIDSSLRETNQQHKNNNQDFMVACGQHGDLNNAFM